MDNNVENLQRHAGQGKAQRDGTASGRRRPLLPRLGGAARATLRMSCFLRGRVVACPAGLRTWP